MRLLIRHLLLKNVPGKSFLRLESYLRRCGEFCKRLLERLKKFLGVIKTAVITKGTKGGHKGHEASLYLTCSAKSVILCVMKRVIKIAAVFLFLVIGCFGLIPTTAATSAEVAEPSAAELASLYGRYCSRCHGSDGRSNTAKGRETDADDLTTSDVQNMTAARMGRIIKNGKGDMPGFPKLTAAQVAAIVKHVKSF